MLKNYVLKEALGGVEGFEEALEETVAGSISEPLIHLELRCAAGHEDRSFAVTESKKQIPDGGDCFLSPSKLGRTL